MIGGECVEHLAEVSASLFGDLGSEGPAFVGQGKQYNTAISGVLPSLNEVLLDEAVREAGNRRRGHRESFSQFAGGTLALFDELEEDTDLGHREATVRPELEANGVDDPYGPPVGDEGTLVKFVW